MNTTTANPLHRPTRAGAMLRKFKRILAAVLGMETHMPATHAEPAIPEPDDTAPTLPQVLRPEISVGTSSLNQGLGEAIQQAIKDFVRKHVQPIHTLDASIYFRLDAVCIHETEAARPHLKSFFQMAERLRIRFLMALIRNAHGANAMLDATRLASVSCVPMQGPLDGFAGTVLMVFERAELPLTIEFIGEFEEREPAAELPAAPASTPTPATLQSPAPHVQPMFDNFVESGMESTTTLYTPPTALGGEVTGFESTPLAPSFTSGPEPVLMLTMRLQGRADRSYPVYERDLPLAIGRHVGQIDAMLPTDCFVSRTHLVLLQIHAGKSLLIFEDRSTNGSWDRSGRKATRFGYVLGQDGWLSLGGKPGEHKAAQLSVAAA